MLKSQLPQHIEGSKFHVGDCQIWAEIHYLDSPTHYREYLPQNCAPRSIGELQMLDDLSSPAALRAKTLIRILSRSLRAILGQSPSNRIVG
jgi:hypothetical protein